MAKIVRQKICIVSFAIRNIVADMRNIYNGWVEMEVYWILLYVLFILLIQLAFIIGGFVFLGKCYIKAIRFCRGGRISLEDKMISKKLMGLEHKASTPVEQQMFSAPIAKRQVHELKTPQEAE